MVKFVQLLVIVTSSLLLSACVTQNFDKDKPVIEKNSSNNELAITRVSLGLGYLKMGNTGQAKFNLEKAKKYAPNLVEVHTAFAHYFETVDEPELTIKSYEKALSIKSDDANTLNNYGVFLCRQERYVEAEKQFLKAIAIPSYLLVSESYENLASCQLKAGDFDKAERYLAKAITHSPNRGSALFQMIRLEYAMGNYKKARRYTQKFEKVTRRFKPESLALSLKVYQKLGNQKTARNYGSMLVSMYPESWEAKQYVLNGLNRIEADDLAELYQESKAKGAKTKTKKRVIKLSPNGKSSIAAINDVKTSDSSVAVVKPLVKQALQAPSPVIVPVISASTTAIAGAAVLTEKEASETSGIVETPLEQPAENIEINTAKPDDEANVETQLNEANVETQLNEVTVNEGTANLDNAAAIAVTTNIVDEFVIESDSENVSVVVEPNEQEVAAKIQATDTDNELNNSIASNDNTPAINIDEQTGTNVDNIDANSSDDELESEELTESAIIDDEAELEEPAERAFHIVVKGDNLYGISIKYNTQMKALKRWNNFGDDLRIRIGDKIYIEEDLVVESLDE